jgi:uncharacterized protein YqgC (DUF456 family)
VTSLDVLVGLACLVGIVGTIIPVLPGTLLCAAAVALWGVINGGTPGWAAVIAAILLLALSTGLKYLIPARWLKEDGVPSWVLVVGGIAGVVGFFVIPVVGLILGFIAGIFLAEVLRLRSPARAWPTTWTAMKAAGLSSLIELAGALFITASWVTAAFLR